MVWAGGRLKVNLCSQLLTKDHELSLKKQQEDVNALRRHLDHVISFTKWATESHSGTALLYCKRLVSDLANKWVTASSVITIRLSKQPQEHDQIQKRSYASSPSLQDPDSDAPADESQLQSPRQPPGIRPLSLSLRLLGLERRPR